MKAMEEVLGKKTMQKLLKEFALTLKPTGDIQMFEYKGVMFPDAVCTPPILDALQTWKARQKDVFITTYPKAGTTWMQEIVSSLVNKGDLEKVNQSHTNLRVPFLEAKFLSTPELPTTLDIVDKMRSARTIKSHLAGHIFPPDALKKKSRIVYVGRNPKDVCVSFYHFAVMNPGLPTPKSWEAFFEDFLTGKVAFGPWWDHYLFFWNLRNDPNVLFVKFEDMKRDLKPIVQKVATFWGYSYSDDIINGVVDHCSFASMKKNPMTNPDTMIALFHKKDNSKPDTPLNNDNNPHENASFMRKGKVGDWKNYLTVAQNEILEAQIEENLAGSGLTFNY